MRLPVVKILWGMFAFPIMYPGAFLGAAGLPLIGIIAVSLFWVTGAPAAMSGMPWVLVFADGLLLSWLAVRCHRVVLLGAHEDVPAHRAKSVANYLAAVIAGTLVLSVFVAIVSFRYIPTGADPASADGMIGLPWWVIRTAQALPFYLLARVSLMLPGFALGEGWRLTEAWRRSRGNGWRLVIVVFMLPVAFDYVLASAYGYVYPGVAIALIGIFKAFLSAESVIALSLSYRELTPAPPPTTPPA